MSGCADTLLRRAILALRRNGDDEIATALERRLIGTDGAPREPCQAAEAAALADDIFACGSLGALHAVLPRVAATLGGSHCTIHCVGRRETRAYSARVLTTYPEAWSSEYVEKRYALVDPVVARCLKAPGTFSWDEVSSEHPEVRAFFAAAEARGVGPAGITLVAGNAHGDLVAVSLSSADEPAAFRRAFAPRLLTFGNVAALMIEVHAEHAAASSPGLPWSPYKKDDMFSPAH